MAVDYLKDYLGVDPNDYSAMEQGIAGISPLAPGQSIIPQTASMPRASIMSEGDFANATAPLMGRVYQREAEGRERAEGLSKELQALQEEMAQTSEAEIQKRADLERQIQNIMQERDVSRTSAEDLAGQLQGVQTNLQEITQLRDKAVQDYEDALAQQDVIRQQAAEDQARQLEEQRNALLAERESIVTTLEQDFGVQRSELESLVGSLEGKVGELESVKGSLQGEIDNLSSQMQSLELEKQDALAQQDIIRAESAQAQQDALAQQAEQFTGERSSLEQQIADLQAQITQQQPPVDAPPPSPPPTPPFTPPNREPEPINITDIPLTAPIAMPRNPDMVKMIQDKMGQDQLFIDDGPMDRDDFIASMPNEKPVPFIPKPPMVPPRDDFISYERIGDGGGGVPVGGSLSVGVPGTDMFKQFPIPGQMPKIIDEIPRPKPVLRPLPIKPGPKPVLRPLPIKPKMTPPQKPISIGGIGGGFRRPTMRANGGTISQAIADLQSKLK